MEPLSAAGMISGDTYVVSLAGVCDAGLVAITLTDVNDSCANHSDSISTPQMGFLIGDANGDGFVNAGDTLQTRNRAGQITDTTNFRSDVNTDGFVNSGDTTVVRARSGSALP